ncbi:hypothetical protein Lal_00019635 [Lupinus albus]|nr:hypothetical protein Lal_00019635 [Lupinus albus]
MPITASFIFSIYFPIFPLLLILTVSPFCGGHSGGTPPHELWCVAKNNAEDATLQDALNWACGPGGVDCGPIQQGGPCYDANNVQNTASFAFNDYFRKHGLTYDGCNFNNNAAITTLNPSQLTPFPSCFCFLGFEIFAVQLLWVMIIASFHPDHANEDLILEFSPFNSAFDKASIDYAYHVGTWMGTPFWDSLAAVSNGNFSGSAVPMAGLGPTDNMNKNGCSEVSWSWWFWPMSISHLLFLFSVSVIVYG